MVVARQTDTDGVESSSLTSRRRFELTADRGDGSPAVSGVIGCCFCRCCSLISPPARGKMNRLLLSESGDGGAFASLSGAKMLISSYIRHVLWKNKQLSFLLRRSWGRCVVCGLVFRKKLIQHECSVLQVGEKQKDKSKLI